MHSLIFYILFLWNRSPQLHQRSSSFSSWRQLCIQSLSTGYLGNTHCLHCIVMSMKESEMENAPPEWQYSCHSYELANEFFIGMVGACGDNDKRFPTNTSKDPTSLNEWMRLKDKFTMPAFGTLIILGPTEEMMMGENLCIITQAPCPDDGAQRSVCIGRLCRTERRD